MEMVYENNLSDGDVNDTSLKAQDDNDSSGFENLRSDTAFFSPDELKTRRLSSRTINVVNITSSGAMEHSPEHANTGDHSVAVGDGATESLIHNSDRKKTDKVVTPRLPEM